jgi:chemotaxis protein methyltransferase CheR
MRWEAFRKVRGQVCKRIERRRQALGLPDLAAYQQYLEHHSAEWAALDTFCRITISRFYRDRQTCVFVEREVLPTLAGSAVADESETLDIWSAGCAIG